MNRICWCSFTIVLVFLTSFVGATEEEGGGDYCHGYLRNAIVDPEIRSTYEPVNEIIPNLWLGNECEVINNAANYDVIISMSAEHNFSNLDFLSSLGFSYYRYPLWDSGGQGKEFINEMLVAAANTIHSQLELGKKVLVHCQMGKSRSTSAVIAYLLMHHDDFKDQTFHKVWTFVKEKRPIAVPNRHFMKVLEEL